MARKKAESKQVVNPFDKGVSYADFLKALPEGVEPSEYLKGLCSDEQIEWLKIELKHYKEKN